MGNNLSFILRCCVFVLDATCPTKVFHNTVPAVNLHAEVVATFEMGEIEGTTLKFTRALQWFASADRATNADGQWH